MQTFISIILAAGMGKRMKSELPKVLHKVCGKELCGWVADASTAAGADKVVAVVGHKAEQVGEYLKGRAETVLQKEQLGTGHAVMQAGEFIKDFGGYAVILNGDTPLVTSDTIKEAVLYHENSGNAATVITAILNDSTGYGRIVRGADGNVVRIVEQKDADENELQIKEVNSGMYVFNAQDLMYALDKITPNNAQGEYYLTDTLEILLEAGKKIGGFSIEDSDEIRGINDKIQLSEANEIMQRRINERHMKNGVIIIHPETVSIENDVEIGQDTVVEQNTVIKGDTKIGVNSVIGANSKLVNAVIHDNVNITCSVITDSEVDEGTNVGPFAYIRPGSSVGKNVKVGDFVELKNTKIGDGTKISHLTYIGDTDVGKDVNFGCGTVTVNYDGSKKYRTTIGDNAFIGCNTNLVSPVTVHDNAYIAAGSTITDDVPESSLAIARSRQVIKSNWTDKRK